MNLFLLRHGTTDWNREPARCQGWAEVGLNEQGRGEARERGRSLRERGIEVVVSSHLRRARETAAIVCEQLAAAVPLVIDPRLAETHRGDWEARLFSEIMRNDADRWRAYGEQPAAFRFPGGESLAEQQRRVLGAVRDAVRDGRTALFVTHGGSIRVVRCFMKAGEAGGLAGFHDARTGNGVVEDVPTDGLVERITTFLDG